MKNNQSGFSLFEVLLGVMIAALTFYLIAHLQVSISKNQASLIQKLESHIDTSLAEKMIFTDLKNMSHSYNNVFLKDDSGLGFFDYFSDMPEASIQQKVSRILTLTESNEIIFVTQNSWDGPILIYDPLAAYKIGAKTTNFNTSSSVDFISLNHQDWLKNQRPNFWNNGKILLLDTSARVRSPTNSSGEVNMQIPARSPIYIGQVQGQQFSDLSGLRSKLNLMHPLDNKNITSVDQFLRSAPSSGGGIPLIRVLSVNIIRYSLEKQNDHAKPNAKMLLKSTFDGSQFANSVMVANDLENVIFKRDSVTEKVTYFVLNKIK